MKRSEMRISVLGKEEDNAWKINENLPIYWKALPGDVQKTWYIQNLYDKNANEIDTVLSD
jgi:hypothetical protein